MRQPTTVLTNTQHQLKIIKFPVQRLVPFNGLLEKTVRNFNKVNVLCL